MRSTVVALLGAVGVVVTGLMAPILAAAANPPEAVDVGFTLPPGVTGCGFEVGIEATGKAKTVELPDGRTIFTSPGLAATVTNLNNGNAVSLNITGSLHVSGADGFTTFVATGRNLLWGGVENALVLTRGRFTWTFDPAGNASPQAGAGHKTDVCALVA